AWGFLKQQINGSHPKATTVFSMPTICGPTAADDSIQALTGRTPQTLSNGTLTVNYSTAGTLVNRMPPSFPVVDPRDPDNLGTDPTATPAAHDPLPSGTVDVPLFGNQWTLAAGHRIRLDLTQVDYPTFLASNSLGALLTFPNAQLVLPTREATEMALAGA